MLSFLGFCLSLMILSLFKLNWWNSICMLLMGLLLMNLQLCSNLMFTSASLCLGFSYSSHVLVMLSVFIVLLSILSSRKISFSFNGTSFLLSILCLNLILVLTFVCLNSLFFFFCFESTLIPTLYLILGWGYKVERVQSGFYMLFYTILGSFPLLTIIMYHYVKSSTVFFDFMYFFQDSGLLYFFLMFGFMVKMPMFLVHSWLPKAHVEAPVSGSMILAGILLKLGGYGVLKFMTTVPLMISKYSFYFICLSLLGGVLSSVICLRQTDLKSLIAYSSVAHMSLVIGGLLSQNLWGMYFSVLLMVGHGLCSSGLFYLTSVNYDRCHSRSIYLNKGLMTFLPNLSMWWFMFNACNMSCPPSLNLLSEIGLMNSILSWSFWTMVFLALISFLSACYSLYLFSFTQHGTYYSIFTSFYVCYVEEFLILFLHWVPLNLLFLFTELFI